MTTKYIAISLLCALSLAAKPKMKSDLLTVPDSETRNVIVVFAKGKKQAARSIGNYPAVVKQLMDRPLFVSDLLIQIRNKIGYFSIGVQGRKRPDFAAI